MNTRVQYCIVIICCVVLCTSCATYNSKISNYYKQVQSGSYEKAVQSLDANTYLKKDRNQFLYLAEKGRVAYLMNNSAESNKFLNQADEFAEDQRKTLANAVSGTLLNPMMQSYFVQDFERSFLHFYKALNYCSLDKVEDAIVEARRITLDNDLLSDLKKEKADKFSKDAFSLILQGAVYEKKGDINNAFIAYRNAAEVYLSRDNQQWYGVTIPSQLKQDVIRTAYLNGFAGEQQQFEQLFGQQYIADTADGGYAIIFVEYGRAPIKEEKNIAFTLINDVGVLTYASPDGQFSIPFPVGFDDDNNTSKKLKAFRLALPECKPVTVNNLSVKVTSDNYAIQMEPVIDLNNIAVSVQKENRVKDITNGLIRLATKAVAKAAAQALAKEIAKQAKANGDDVNMIGSVVGLAAGTFNFLSEKADTRNWQTLPSAVQYVRVPLQKGMNRIMIKPSAGTSKIIEMEGNGSLQMKSVYINK